VRQALQEPQDHREQLDQKDLQEHLVHQIMIVDWLKCHPAITHFLILNLEIWKMLSFMLLDNFITSQEISRFIINMQSEGMILTMLIITTKDKRGYIGELGKIRRYGFTEEPLM